MHIDKPTPGDIPDLRRIWQEAFGDSDAFLDGFFETGFHPERCRCLRLGQRVAAALYWFDCRLGQKRLAYIYAVATEKASRGRGLCRSLTQDTHRHLQSLGYHGWLLVPANEKLFSMYEAMGYRPFCPMQWVEVEATKATSLRQLTAAEYEERRAQLLPEKGIEQEGMDYLAGFSRFYAGEGSLLCVSHGEDGIWVQEHLGDREELGGAIAALGAEKAQVHLPGGSPYAMFYGGGEDLSDAYFGLSMG